MDVLMLIGAVAVVLVIAVIMITNDLKRKELKVDEAFSGIEVALTKRYDMLTKMVDTVKGYIKHEQEVFADVSRVRSGMSMGELSSTERALGQLQSQVYAVAERYPDIKADSTFGELQRAIEDVEEHLQAARRLYNANVNSYNTALVVFPSSLFAGGRKPRELFEAEEYKREDVKIEF